MRKLLLFQIQALSQPTLQNAQVSINKHSISRWFIIYTNAITNWFAHWKLEDERYIPLAQSIIFDLYSSKIIFFNTHRDFKITAGIFIQKIFKAIFEKFQRIRQGLDFGIPYLWSNFVLHLFLWNWKRTIHSKGLSLTFFEVFVSKKRALGTMIVSYENGNFFRQIEANLSLKATETVTFLKAFKNWFFLWKIWPVSWKKTWNFWTSPKVEKLL